MNNNTWIGIGIAVVIIIIGSFIYMNMSGGSSSVATDTATTTATQDTSADTSAATATGVPAKGSGALKNILTQTSNDNYTCTFQSTDPALNTSGEMYVAGGKVRGDFHKKADVGTIDTFIINNGTNVYAWSQGSTTGYKSPTASYASVPLNMTGGVSLGSASDQVGWDCHPWIADKTKFVIPTYVKFI